MRLIILCIFFIYLTSAFTRLSKQPSGSGYALRQSHIECQLYIPVLIPRSCVYCEIKLIDSAFTHLEIREQSQERASAGESVLINNITLKASTVYHYNVSAVLEDESTPPVVVVWGSSPHHLQVSSVHGLHFIIFCILALEPLSNGLMTEVKFLRLIPKMR